LYTDFLWFDSVGFSTIFKVTFFSKLCLFFAGAVFFFAFAMLNLWIASKFQKAAVSLKVGAVVIFVISIILGFFSARAWITALQYFNQAYFNLADPILGKDASFYVFSLPFFLSVWKFLFACLLFTGVVVGLYYLQRIISSYFTKRVDPNTNMVYESVNIKQELSNIKRAAMVHLAVLGSLLFALLAVHHYLAIFSVMYSEKGIVVGAGYTDVYVFLPVVKILMLLAVVIALFFYVWIFYFSKDQRIKKRHIVLFVIILYVAFVFVGQFIIPSLVQSFVVSPNELNLEKPFIENNIHFTKLAYGLDTVEEEDFLVVQNISQQALEEEKETVDNIRILDWRPLSETYRQMQEIRLYYDLTGVDVDRYNIDGKYTEIMLAPRELSQEQITDDAKTWVNLHMIYSHGFGLVMSPVNNVTKEGLPDYLIKDIPPVYSQNNNKENKNDLRIDQPRIYYGELENDFIFVNTRAKEFDYPKGNANEYFNYDGKGGVMLDSSFRKFMLALRFRDVKMLLSSDITPESRVMFKRNIKEMASTITPFLMLDYDPYLVIADGRLYWIQDAYTTTNNFPYSHKVYLSPFKSINYIRNSVKIVVDAYDGDITYYVIDEKDPLMQTYTKIFPEQFKLFKHMPESLKSHIRYPENLFKIQSKIFSTYHMNDLNVFYNKEDAWDLPNEIYGAGQKVVVEPYYIIIKLPEEKKEEFVLMTSFTPIKKDNMVSWLAARSDGQNYGKLLLYKFPKDKLIYGPLQVEAKIDQDAYISQQLTLWSQQGSRVTRGNLMVLPIKNSILYIEPLYLQAENGQLPELKRVIVSDGERVVMEKDTKTALESLFGKAATDKERTDNKGKTYNKEKADKNIIEKREERNEKDSAQLIEDANNYYVAIETAMREGDWQKLGENFDLLGNVLEELLPD
jgi:uncharacterized membrane protein (UPF0182 family)